MSKKANPIAHCERLIERARAELERREARGEDAERVRDRLKTLRTLRTAHMVTAARSEAA
jgi:hypothetical protein